jgi:hypothetical protein
VADAPVFWSHLDAVPGLPGPLFAMTAPDAIGEATLGETPECNGRCGENNVGGADFFDVDRECPIHGDATDDKPEWCIECKAGVEIVEQSIETSGYEEQQRDYHVTRLSCGHEIAVEVKQR